MMPPPLGLPPPPHPNDQMLIPQPAAPPTNLAVASAMSMGGAIPTLTTGIGGAGAVAAVASSIGVSLATKVGGATTAAPSITVASTADDTGKKKKSKNKLVFAGDTMDEHGEEASMEELRMRVPRYWNLVVKALAKRCQVIEMGAV